MVNNIQPHFPLWFKLTPSKFEMHLCKLYIFPLKTGNDAWWNAFFFSCPKTSFKSQHKFPQLFFGRFSQFSLGPHAPIRHWSFLLSCSERVNLAWPDFSSFSFSFLAYVNFLFLFTLASVCTRQCSLWLISNLLSLLVIAILSTFTRRWNHSKSLKCKFYQLYNVLSSFDLYSSIWLI